MIDEFLARAKDNVVQSFLKIFLKIRRADIHIRIGGSIIQIPIEQTSIRPIIPITTDTWNSQAQQDPMVRGRLFHIPL
jgi:hypothetical protein